MATTCKLIAKTALGSTASTIEFTSIPATYDDLLIVLSTRCNRSTGLSDEIRARFNGASTDANLSVRLLQGAGSAGAGSYSLSYGYIGEAPATSATASTFGNCEVYVPNYAGSTNKSYSVSDAHETNGTQAYISATAGLWSSTAAITSISFRLGNASSFVADSSAYLYGIKK